MLCVDYLFEDDEQTVSLQAWNAFVMFWTRSAVIGGAPLFFTLFSLPFWFVGIRYSFIQVSNLFEWDENIHNQNVCSIHASLSYMKVDNLMLLTCCLYITCVSQASKGVDF